MTRTSRAAIVAAIALCATLGAIPTPVGTTTASPTATSAAEVRAQSVLRAETSNASSIAIPPSTASATLSAPGTTPTTADVERVYASVASVTSKTSDDTNTAMSEATIQKVIAGINTYWASQSGGAVHVVFGGYEARALGTKSCNPTSVLAAEEATAFGGKFANDAWIGTHDHLLVLSRESCGKESFATVGGDGGEIFSGNGATGVGAVYLLHEFGHNLGFEHADASTCENTRTADAPIADFSFASTVCPTTEYDDYLDIMGYTAPGATPNLSSPQRIAAGWLTDYATATSANRSETVVLSPLGGAGGTRALKIEDPVSDDAYYVEYRADAGLDGTSAEFHYARQCGTAHGGYRVCNLGGTSAGVVRILRALPFAGTSARGTTVEAVGAVAGSATERVSRMTLGQTFVNYDDGFTLRLVSIAASRSATVTVSFDSPAITSTSIATNHGSQVYATANPASARATVTALRPGAIPGGTVRFYDGKALIGSAPVDSKGAATFVLPRSLAVGPHDISGRFAPDSADTGASSGRAATFTVNRVPSSVALSLSSSSTSRASAEGATVTVKTTGTPVGTLTFYSNGKAWKSYTLGARARGHVVITLPRFALRGRKSITVRYSGTPTVAGSQAAGIAVTVH